MYLLCFAFLKKKNFLEEDLLILKPDWFHIRGIGMDNVTSSCFLACLQIPHLVDKLARNSSVILFEKGQN